MQLSDVTAVAKREYLVRIKAKGFWIGTLILPIFLVAVSVIPSLLLAKSEARHTAAKRAIEQAYAAWEEHAAKVGA